METVMDIIKKRKSIRKYLDKPVPRDVLDKILEAAKNAPSARNMQPLEYRVVTSKSVMAKLTAGLEKIVPTLGLPQPPAGPPPGEKPDFFRGGRVLILVTAPKDSVWAGAEAGLAVGNIMLYATSIGLGTCFIGMARELVRDKNLLDLLHIGAGRDIAAAVVLGYPDEDPPPKEKKLNVEFF
jgi:nitroreductase